MAQSVPGKHDTYTSVALKSIGRSLALLIFAWAFGHIFPYASELLRSLSTKSGFTAHPTLGAVLVTFLVYSFATTVFFIKETHLRLYGYVEIMFGLALAFVTAQQLVPNFEYFRFLGLIAAMFVVVRGNENIHSADQQSE